MSRRKENETRPEENEGNINHKGAVLAVVKAETRTTHDAAWLGALHGKGSPKGRLCYTISSKHVYSGILVL